MRGVVAVREEMPVERLAREKKAGAEMKAICMEVLFVKIGCEFTDDDDGGGEIRCTNC